MGDGGGRSGRGRLGGAGWFMRIAALSWPFGFIAILSGWTVAEVGRQPWLATGILRTVDAASPVPAAAVATTLVWSGIGSLILYKIVDIVVGLRATPDKEREGLDITDHGERVYNM